jgi:hypothetical protein
VTFGGAKSWKAVASIFDLAVVSLCLYELVRKNPKDRVLVIECIGFGALVITALIAVFFRPFPWALLSGFSVALICAILTQYYGLAFLARQGKGGWIKK